MDGWMDGGVVLFLERVFRAKKKEKKSDTLLDNW